MITTIDTIPDDVFNTIGMHLSYSEFSNINSALHLKLSNEHMFVNSVLFKTHNDLQEILDTVGVSASQFYNILEHSSMDAHSIYNLLYAIQKNEITNKTKYEHNVSANITDINPEKIKNTIAIIQIIHFVIERQIRKDFIINNPYHYLTIYITNCIVEYFQTIVMNNYCLTVNIEKVSTKFKLALFDNRWYNSNINIFNIYLLYLLSIDSIHSKNIIEIYTIYDTPDIGILPNLKSQDEEYNMSLEKLFFGKIQAQKLKDIIYHSSFVN